MNLNAGKPYRARLGFAGLLGTIALTVVAKVFAVHGDAPAALATPAGKLGTSGEAKASEAPKTATPSPGPRDAGDVGDAATASASASAGPSGTVAPRLTGTQTVVGDPIDTKYGPVQVQVVITDGKITDVVPLVLPSRERRDIEINNSAVPILRQEVIDIQSAKIDIVSGASYTSSGYAWSVQSAIDKAGL